MADARTVQSWTEKNEFLLRRLHSLSGILPIGVFLIEHLYTNSLAALGAGGAIFDEHVHWLHEIPYLMWIEFLFIFLPIAFHAVYGVVIARSGRLNVGRYAYVDNWRYTLQRITAWIVICFVVIHLLHYRFGWLLGGEEYVGTDRPFGLMQEGFLGIAQIPTGLWYVVYAVGLTASVYHFANGLCTFCITWGITVSDTSRIRASVAAGGLGVLLMVWGVMTLWAIGTKMPGEIVPDETDAGVPIAERVVTPHDES